MFSVRDPSLSRDSWAAAELFSTELDFPDFESFPFLLDNFEDKDFVFDRAFGFGFDTVERE